MTAIDIPLNVKIYAKKSRLIKQKVQIGEADNLGIIQLRAKCASAPLMLFYASFKIFILAVKGLISKN